MRSGEFEPICFMENSLYRLKSYFSGRNLLKFGKKKKTSCFEFWECLSLKVLLGIDNWKKISFSFALFALIIVLIFFSIEWPD